MKKLILMAAAVGLLIGGANVSAQATTTATTSAQVDAYLAQLKLLRQLQQGMTGEDVKVLQATLAAQADIYPEGIITGYYGPMTAKAVQKYQEKFGIPAVGRVGPMTLSKLNELISYNNDEVKVKLNKSDLRVATTTSACVNVPPGHLIAPGWLKKNGAVAQVSDCQKLPPGIAKKLNGTTTPPTNTPTSTPVVDVKAPVIRSIAFTNITASTSRVIWNTNERATSRLIYSTSTPVTATSSQSVTVDDASLILNHSVRLTGLASSTKYYFIVASADAKGNTATSSVRTFTTLAQ